MSDIKLPEDTIDAEEIIEKSNVLLKTSTAALGTLALSACGGAGIDLLNEGTDGGKDSSGTAGGLYPDTSIVTEDPYSTPTSKQQAARFLQKASFSSTQDEINRMMTMSYSTWLNQQFDMEIDPELTLWKWRESGLTPDDGIYLSSTKGDYDGTLRDMMSGEDVLRKRMALALLQILVIGQGLWIAHDGWAKCDYWDTLNEHAFGNYFDLLMDVSRHPIMMTYLTSFNSRGEVEGENHRPDENYAREVMQLFSIGLVELNLDGTPKLDENGEEIPTYDQDTIVNLARIFTGFGWHGYAEEQYPAGSREPVPIRTTDGISWYATQEKSFLGVTIPGDTDQEEAFEIAISTIFNHPNVAPFISNLLIQRFVTSNPSPGYIERVATVFNSNEDGERGNLRSVLTAILLDEEALGVPDESNYNFLGKVREPMLRLAQWYRTFGGYTVSGEWEVGWLGSYSHGIGQLPFWSPSVFNHYYPDFSPHGEGFEENSFVAPEIQILDEVSIAGYINFIWFTLNVGILNKYDNSLVELSCDYVTENTLIGDAQNYVEHLNLTLCAGRLSDETVTDIISAIDERNYTDITGLTGDELAGAERNNLSRREFLKRIAQLSAARMTGATALSLMAARDVAAFSTDDDYKAIVMVHLNGGNDHNSLLIPIDDINYNTYAEIRSGVNIAQEDLLPLNSTEGLAAGYQMGVHPALENTQRLFNRGDAAIIQNIGCHIRLGRKNWRFSRSK